MPKAYSYIRFSSEPQGKGDSVRRQSDAAARYAAAHKLDLDERSYNDLGLSAYKGRNVETGELGTFLEGVRSGAIEQGSYLLVESLDRISRQKPRKAVRTLEDLCEAGITVVTLTDGKAYTSESLDDDPMALMWALMVAIRAHEESATKGRRVRSAWANKRARASEKPLTAMTPAWLTLKDDKIVPIPERVKIVKRIFRMTLDGHGKAAIAQTLNGEGVEPWGRGNTKAMYWHRSYVAKILSHPAVYGSLFPGTVVDDGAKITRRPTGEEVKGYYPAVIDAATYKRVQSMRATRARTFTGPKDATGIRNAFAGLCICPTCGGAMAMVYKGERNGKRKLVCRAAKEGAGCQYRSVPYAAVEAAFLNKGQRMLTRLPAKDGSAELESELEGVEAAIAATDEQVENLLDAIARGGSSVALADRLRAAEGQRDELRAEAEALEGKIAAASPRMARARARELVEAMRARKLDLRHVNALLRQLVAGIVIDYDEGELVFRWAHGGESTIPFGMPSETA